MGIKYDILAGVKKIFLCLAILLITAPGWAADSEIPVKIKADKLKYIEGTSLVSAVGSVEITLEDVLIQADELQMDTKTNVVTAEGNVFIHAIDYDAQSQFITYYISTETSEYHNFKTKLAPSTVKGYVFVTAQDILDLHPTMEAREGTVTTCDYDKPHYHTAARRVEYFPNDKIVGYSVTFYIGPVPALWAPYMIYDLKNRRKRNWVMGHNEVEGDFIKTVWDYPSGVVYLDEMQKKSFGQGFDYNYGLGSLFLYHIEEADTHFSDWVSKWNHTVNVNPNTNLNLAYSSSAIYQIPAGRLDQSTYRVEWNHASDRRFNTYVEALDNRAGNEERLNYAISHDFNNFNTNYTLNLDQGKSSPRYIRLTERLAHRQPLFSDNTNLKLNANYSDYINQAGSPGDEKLEPDVEIVNRNSWGSIKYYENWHLDLDRNLFLGDENDQYLERQPEITFTPNSLTTPLLNLSSELGYGYFHEVAYVSALGQNRDFSTGRLKTTLNADKSFPLPLGNNLSLSAGVDQFYYNPGDELYAFRESYGLTSTNNLFVRNNVSFSRGISEGNSPFLFDRLGTKYSNLREILTFFYKDYFNWNTSYGFNYETMKHMNVDSTLNLKPDPILNLNFRSGWDIENQKYIDLISQINVMPWDKARLDLNLVSDMNAGGLKQGSYLVDFETADETDWVNHWRFKLGYVYDTDINHFVLRDIMLVKDLHCWEVSYTYSDYRKEFSLVFTLKAFPGEPIGYAEGRGFYFDSFEKALKEEFSGASPQRY